jgi:prepilin-type processing-associated H-X9-DG protein
MNAMVGDAGEYTRGGYNVNNPAYRQFFRAGDVPEPSRIFLFIEEHPDSINDGYFLNKPGSDEWIDLPASFHNRAANIAYLDGHVEPHRWASAETTPPAAPDAAQLPRPVSYGSRADFQWLMWRTSVSAGGAARY